jgi:hypothetical protein
MTNERLYIIGNGFDIFHGIPSRYSDFGNYLRTNDFELYETIEKYLCLDGDWCDLEAALAWMDADTLADEASDFLVSYGADDWSDAFHHDYQYQIQIVVEQLSTKLKDQFSSWIRNLIIPKMETYKKMKLAINCDSLFLTFNYTSTLETLYKIKKNHILYIHGDAQSNRDELVLGHGWRREERGSLNDVPNPEDLDTRVMQGNDIIDQYFDTTFKNSEDIIEQNKAFFSSLGTVRSICVLGHSLTDVDMPYLEKIVSQIKINDVAWEVSYYSQEEYYSHGLALQNLGVPISRYSLYKMENFHSR